MYNNVVPDTTQFGRVAASPRWLSDLRKTHVLSQIRLATPLAPRSVGVKDADLKPYSERDAVAVGLQADHGSAKAFEQERGCRLQVAELAAASPSGWLMATCERKQALDGWSGCIVLAHAQAHLGELASLSLPSQCVP